MKKKKMLRSFFLNRYSNIITENTTVKIALLVLGATVLLQQHNLSKAREDEFVVVVPAGFNNVMKISRNDADLEYLKQMVRYSTSLYGQITAGNVDRKYSELLALVHPSVYSSFKERLRARASLIKRFSSISYMVEINDSKALEAEGDTLRAYASRRKIIGKEISNPESFVYELKYKITNGKFELFDIKEVVQ